MALKPFQFVKDSHQTPSLLSVAALTALLVLGLLSAQAGTMSSSALPPVVSGESIANLGLENLGGETSTNNGANVTSTDKWFNDGKGTAATTAKGQTFRTGGGALLLRSVTYQAAAGAGAAPTKTYLVRVGTVYGTNFTPVCSETFTQSFTWNQNEYMTWTFATPPLLNGDTVYGVDIGMTSSTSSWQTGIPYLNCTGNDYLNGQFYNSGANGVGAASIVPSISQDRIFYLDLEPPTNSLFEFVAGNPTNTATNAVFSAALVGTFSQNLTLGTGNITLRNLTDATDTSLPVTDPRVSLSANLLHIATPGLLTWNKSYAIRIDPAALKGDGGAPFAGITNDTTWSFTTGPGDPLVLALGELKDYINGLTNLSAAQIAADSVAIESQTVRFGDSTNIISAVFSLVRSYDTVKGPLWLATGSLSRSADTNNLTWTIYHTMQGVMDFIYTAPNLSNYTALLNGFKFNSSSNFPGACAAPPPNQAYTVAINGSFPDSFGRSTLGWNLPARKATGAYLAPGTIATVTVPPSLVGKGYQVRVGAHSTDMSGRPNIPRLDRSSLLYPITTTTTKVASPLGGGIYIEVPQLANAGIVSLTITGAVRSPFFSATSFHQTTPAEWLSERTNPAPWADFQSDKFMMQVPRSWIYNFNNPLTLMSNWDLSMDACNDLMGFPHDRGKETMYYQVDLQMAHSVYAPGYPTVNLSYNPNTDYGGNINQYLITGPQNAAQYVFHEEGHSYFFPKFGGESESTVNLLFAPVLNRKFGVSLDDAFNRSYAYTGNGVSSNLDNTAVLWMTSFDFSPRQVAMADWEKSYQPQGHAKFADLARLYGESGWAGLGAFWSYYNSNDTYGVSYPADTDSLLVRLCKSVGKDVRPLWHFWGIIPSNATNLAAQVAAAGLTPPAEIYDLLVRYQSLLPTNNAAYQAWCLKWYGKQPTMNGYGVEKEHARQWSTNLVNDSPQVRFPTEIYDEAAYAQVAARAQAIIDLYYPNGRPPPTPPVLMAYGPRSGASFPLTFSGPSGQTYHVLSSTNVAAPLLNWTVLSSGTFGIAPVTWTDTNSLNARQFYRIQSP